MANYEVTVIVRPDVSVAQAEQIAKDIEALVKENDGSTIKQENWGLRPIAYRMRKQRKAHYLYFEAVLGSAGLNEVDRRLKLHEDVMRHLVVRVEQFIEGPSAVLSNKQRDERGADAGYGGRDEGYRPRARGGADADAA